MGVLMHRSKSNEVATVEVPFEALVKELGAKRAVEFVSEIRVCYGDSVVELRNATGTLTFKQIEDEVKKVKEKKN